VDTGDLEQQTDNIAENLKYIENHEIYQGEDLEELEKRTAAIVENLRVIEEHEV
jgi:hypothetical protein